MEIINIFAIDPSINNCGWAAVKGLERDDDGVWDDGNADWSYGNVHINSHSLPHKLQEIVEWIMMRVGPDETWWFVGEWPVFYGTRAGQIAATEGHTINLGAIVAYIAGFFRIAPANIHLLTATQWKGSVPKEITKMRFFKILGIAQGEIRKIDHNAIDAVMLLHEFCRRRKISFRLIMECDPVTD